MNHYRGRKINTNTYYKGFLLGDTKKDDSLETAFILPFWAESFDDYIEVDVETVGQYTGLEVDGVKLYDKMRFNFQNEIFRIEWSENLLCWVSIRDRDNVFFQTLNFIRDLEIEIIED